MNEGPAASPAATMPHPTPGCRHAVERCYSGLCRCGQPERYALEAAVTVFRYHHPETSPDQAETIVSHWLAGPVRH